MKNVYEIFGIGGIIETFLWMLLVTFGFGPVMYKAALFGIMANYCSYTVWILIAGSLQVVTFIIALGLIGVGLYLKER